MNEEFQPTVITDNWAQAHLPWPAPTANKYSRGCLVVAAGSEEYPGAAILATLAAPRVGAGYARLVAPEPAAQIARYHLVSEPVTACPAEGGEFTGDAADYVAAALGKANALLMGPGMGRGAGAQDFFWDVLEVATAAGKSLVLDADALYCASLDLDRFGACMQGAAAGCVLTPHEGEAARLLGRKVHNRLADAQGLAETYNCTIVLKGPQTLVASPSGDVWVCDNAGPELAKAGSGDVLAGMVGGLVSQGLDTMDAACLGVYLHAAAGACAAQEIGRISVCPQDIVNHIGPAIMSLGE